MLALLMLRSAKRKVGVVHGSVGHSSSSSPSKKGKRDVSKTSCVGDIEDVPNFLHHKESMHRLSEDEIKGIRTNLLKVSLLRLLITQYTAPSHLCTSLII